MVRFYIHYQTIKINRVTLQTATLKCNIMENFHNFLLYMVVSKSKPCKEFGRTDMT